MIFEIFQIYFRTTQNPKWCQQQMKKTLNYTVQNQKLNHGVESFFQVQTDEELKNMQSLLFIFIKCFWAVLLALSQNVIHHYISNLKYYLFFKGINTFVRPESLATVYSLRPKSEGNKQWPNLQLWQKCLFLRKFTILGLVYEWCLKTMYCIFGPKYTVYVGPKCQTLYLFPIIQLYLWPNIQLIGRTNNKSLFIIYSQIYSYNCRNREFLKK